MDESVRTQPAKCDECGHIFVAGVPDSGEAYIMGSARCMCGSDEFTLLGMAEDKS